MNKKVKIVLLLVLLVLWSAFSWWWYTCGVKGFCEAEYKVQAEQSLN